MKTTWNKSKLAIAAATATVMLSGPASASIFTYKSNIGNGIGNTKITIDSVAGTATYKGRNIDLTISGASLQGFNGVNNSRRAYKADNISGTFTRNGITYNAFQSLRPKHTQIGLGKNYSFLWTYGTSPNGRTFDFDGKGGLKYTGSSGSSSSSSGGGVPAPAPLGLIAAAAFFAGWRRKQSGKA